MKFYPHVNGQDIQTAKFTKVKESQNFNFLSEFLNISDIAESIRKGDILDLGKETPIKKISTEDEPGRTESENESFK